MAALVIRNHSNAKSTKRRDFLDAMELQRENNKEGSGFQSNIELMREKEKKLERHY